jgi:hypothetical protein
MIVRRALVCIGVAATASCSLLVDTIGLAERDPLPGAEEGGSAAEASASLPDGGPFCLAGSRSMVICDDFERTSLDQGWTEITERNNMSMSIVSEEGRRFARIVTNATNATAGGWIARDVATPAMQTIRVSYSMRIDRVPATSAVQLMIFSVGVANSFANVGFYATSTGMKATEQSFAAGGTFHEYPFDRAFPIGVFARVVFELDFRTVPSRIVVSVDGTTVVSQPSSENLRPADMTFTVGVIHAQPSPALQVDIDDYLVEID